MKVRLPGVIVAGLIPVIVTGQPVASVQLRKSVVPMSDADFADALKLWRAFGLPLPQKGSKPIKIWFGSSGGRNLYQVGILETDKSGKQRVYYGARTRSRTSDDGPVFDWQLVSLKNVEMDTWDFGAPGFPVDKLAASALQSFSLGKSDFARALVKKRESERWWLDSGWVGVPKDKSIRAAVALLVATHLVNELVSEKGSWDRFLPRFSDLEKTKLVVPARAWVSTDLKALIQTMKPLAGGTRSADPVQAAVDGLVNITIDPDIYRNELAEPQCQKILAHGLEAVPALAKEMDRPSYTRCFVGRLMNNPPHLLEVKDVAWALIRKIADGDLGVLSSFTSRDALNWLRAKRTNKVEDWLMSSLVERSQSDPSDAGANSRTFEVIAKKYPHLYRQAAKTVIQTKPHIGAHAVFQCLRDSRLSHQQQVEIALMGASSAFTDDRLAAMWELFKLDIGAFNRCLIRTMNEIGTSGSDLTLDGKRAELSMFATGTGDPKVWSSLEAAIRRTDAVNRVMLLENLDGGYDGLEPVNRKREALQLLRKFFDDPDSPVMKKDDRRRRIYLYAADSYPAPRTVGQMALFKAGQILNLVEPGYFDRKPKSYWVALRKKVNARLRAN
ncbi:MAG: hypothetical protein ABL949_09145 [Fimbriimonadaceae bacterium]